MKCYPDTFAVWKQETDINLKHYLIMKKMVILAGLLACIGINAQAQDTTTVEPKGKAIVQVFGNFHAGFGEQNNDMGFELDRSYLGYEYKLEDGLTV